MALATFKDLCLDAADAERLGTFWAGALGLELRAAGKDSNGDVLLVGPTPRAHGWVNQVPEPKTAKHRIHLDVNVGSVDELTRLGATVVDADTFRWTLLADPEGGELCAFVREGEIERAALRDRGRQRRLGAGVPPDRRVVGRRARRPASRRRRLLLRRGRAGGAVRVDRLRAGAGAEDREEPVHLDVPTADVDALVAPRRDRAAAQDDEIRWTVLADPDGNEFCAFAPTTGLPEKRVVAAANNWPLPGVAPLTRPARTAPPPRRAGLRRPPAGSGRRPRSTGWLEPARARHRSLQHRRHRRR